MNEIFSPTISVIIPLYNAEKYLGTCLESLTIQTFTDFEVIVVDDCSTDSSLAVAESYLDRFNGRLKIFSLPENTGSGAIPRNEGLNFSRGEYVYFMDNDDLLVDNALETLYDVAEKFLADVVFMEQGFICDEENSLKNLTPVSWTPPEFVRNEIFLESDELGERLEIFFRKGYGVPPWIKFLRRDFLLANKIIFPSIKISEDVIWTIQVICLAKKFLRVPNRLYVYRSVKNSWSRIKRTTREEIKFWLDPLIKGVDGLDKFLSDLKFFVENPAYRFKVTNFFVKMQLARMLGALDELSDAELYEILHGELSKGDGKHAALISNLMVFMNFYRNKNPHS